MIKQLVGRLAHWLLAWAEGPTALHLLTGPAGVLVRHLKADWGGGRTLEVENVLFHARGALAPELRAKYEALTGRGDVLTTHGPTIVRPT